MARYVGLIRDTSRGTNFEPDGYGYSSIELCDDHLAVVGILPHGAKFVPRDIEYADDLISWLQSWKRKQAEAPFIAYEGDSANPARFSDLSYLVAPDGEGEIEYFDPEGRLLDRRKPGDEGYADWEKAFPGYEFEPEA